MISSDQSASVAAWFSFLAAGASVVAVVAIGTWNYSASKRALTNNIVLTYFDAVNGRKLSYPPQGEEINDWRRFIARLEYIADLANKGMIDDDMVPNSIKCDMLTAQMASFGDAVLGMTTVARAVRVFNDREHKGCEMNLPPIPHA